MASFLHRKKELIFLITLLLIGGFLRFYRFRPLLQFHGDQGRDAIIAKKILIDHDFTLIGPVTSVGNMYLGPFYYYFMVPWLMLTYPDPVGPAIAIATIGTLTIAALYFITKEMFGPTPAIITASLYTFSTVVVTNTRFSWNPNLAPIVGLLIIYCLFKALVKQKHHCFFWSLVLFALIIQLHYISLVLAPVIITTIIWSLVKNKNKLFVVKFTLTGIFAFILLSLPLVIFDLRHDLINYYALKNFLTSSQEHVRPLAKIALTFKDTRGNTHKILAQLLLPPNIITDQIIFLVGLIGSFWLFFTYKANQKKALILLLIVFGFSILGVSFYTSPIFDHYLGYLFTAPFILAGIILTYLWQAHRLGKLTVLLICLSVIIVNLTSTPALANAGVTVDDIKATSNQILQSVDRSHKYNLALIALTRDFKAMNYRYFLETSDFAPSSPDDYGQLDELYVIVEPPFEDPLDTEAFEIKYPNLKTIDKIITGPKNITIFKLVR